MDAAAIINAVVTWLRLIGIPLWTLGIMVVGIACLEGRYHWARFGATIAGAVLFFAAATIVIVLSGGA
jgi:type IV secretory pathway VirB2 component (pilin)